MRDVWIERIQTDSRWKAKFITCPPPRSPSTEKDAEDVKRELEELQSAYTILQAQVFSDENELVERIREGIALNERSKLRGEMKKLKSRFNIACGWFYAEKRAHRETKSERDALKRNLEKLHSEYTMAVSAYSQLQMALLPEAPKAGAGRDEVSGGANTPQTPPRTPPQHSTQLQTSSVTHQKPTALSKEEQQLRARLHNLERENFSLRSALQEKEKVTKETDSVGHNLQATITELRNHIASLKTMPTFPEDPARTGPSQAIVVQRPIRVSLPPTQLAREWDQLRREVATLRALLQDEHKKKEALSAQSDTDDRSEATNENCPQSPRVPTSTGSRQTVKLPETPERLCQLDLQTELDHSWAPPMLVKSARQHVDTTVQDLLETITDLKTENRELLAAFKRQTDEARRFHDAMAMVSGALKDFRLDAAE